MNLIVSLAVFLTEAAIALTVAGYRYSEHHSIRDGLSGFCEGVGAVTISIAISVSVIQGLLYLLKRKPAA